MKAQLRERNAAIFPSPQRLQLPEEEVYFETTRRLHEVRVDLEYRYLDLDEGLNAMQAAIKLTSDSLQDAIALEVINEQQLEITNRLLAVLRRDKERFAEEVEDIKQDLQSFFEKMPGNQVKEWLDGQFLDELETLHQKSLKLDKHTHLIMTVWRSIAEVEEETSYSHL